MSALSAPSSMAAWFGTQPAPAALPACAMQEVVQRIEAQSTGTPHVLVTGAVRSGKSTLAAQLRTSWPGCVVHLHRAATPLAGFASAPLTGEWQGRGTAVQSAELGDILATRPDGVFTLEMPAQADTEVVLSALLWPVLLGSPEHGGTGLATAAAAPAVTLMLEDPAEWLVEYLLLQLLSRGRALDMRVVVISPEADAVSAPLWENIGHVLALRTGLRPENRRLAAWFELPEDALARLPEGLALYRPLSAEGEERPATRQVQLARPG